MAITKNLVSDFGAVGNGSTDDGPAFASFGVWALANQGSPAEQIILELNSGLNFFFAGPLAPGANTWAAGIKKLQVVGLGTGATISSDAEAGTPFFGSPNGVFQDAAQLARVQTVSAGASTLNLVTSSEDSRFTVQEPALITGGDAQGASGFPPNPYFLEYVTPTNISSGALTLSGALAYSYKSTWPDYNPSLPSFAWVGGPATLYVLRDEWDATLEYVRITFDLAVQFYAIAKTVTLTDCVNTGASNFSPTQGQTITLNNFSSPTKSMEIDKLIDALNINTLTMTSMFFQSRSGANLATINGLTLTVTMNGTPRKLVMTSSTLAEITLGPTGYGVTDEILIRNSVISAISSNPSFESNVETTYTMSGGVLSRPLADDAVQWLVPGAYYFFGVANYPNYLLFRVLDVYTSGSNVCIQTSLSGGFPAQPAVGALTIRSHPAPICTFSNVTGCSTATSLSLAPAGRPYASYGKKTFTGDFASQYTPTDDIWGNIVSVKVNVLTPYTGVQGTLTVSALNDSGMNCRKADMSSYLYDPVINLKIAGERVITLAGVTGQQTGDSDLAMPEALWASSDWGPNISADITGENPSVWPVYTVEIITDQGVTDDVVPPPTLPKGRGKQHHLHFSGPWTFSR